MDDKLDINNEITDDKAKADSGELPENFDLLAGIDDNLSDSEKIDIVAKRIYEKYRKAFEELAKL